MHKTFTMYEKKVGKKVQPLTKYLSKWVTNNVDHSPTEMEFVTSGDLVQVWSYERSKPIYELQWNVDSILKVKYNPSEHNILLGSCSDRSLILYDLRAETPIQKITLPNKSMCMAFNPLEPINFTIGNDDSNCYSFDLRRMDKAKTIHKDHIGAVTDLDFSPTGREFTTGSFDRTVRIFKHDEGRSREVYHTRRMQIISSVSYTMDGNYVLSGSEDMNIRIWKNIAHKPTGVINQRESRAIEYREKLV
jgi:WD repeat and SOF domain-containing protein 1